MSRKSPLNPEQIKRRIDIASNQQDLPTPDSSNIGKCNRSDPVLQGVEYEVDKETISSLEKYETAHSTRKTNAEETVLTESQTNSQTQDSEICPNIYRDILLKNCSEDLTLAQSKLLNFDHSSNLQPEDIQSVEENRKKARKLKIFEHILKQMEVTDAYRYYHIEKESYTETYGNPRALVEKSSQTAMPIIDELMEETKELITHIIKHRC